MKNFPHYKEPDTASVDIQALINRYMTGQHSHASFEHLKLEGENVGAAMIVRHHGTSDVSPDGCSINIYVNNNIQGVNNSILVGSELKMGEPGVCLSLKDLKLHRGFSGAKRSKSELGLWLMILLLAFVVLLFSLLSAT
ncbi:unnamed protein product [Ilex paraguariensis]|uniref:Uncharacterized protein n=1 Tax=Ilex paraguariensis TaxID=185542 RepID=A0ABC8QLB5_9AQUA